MKQYNFEDSNLPKVNPNENLETISNNFFRPLFGTDKFEIRSETQRDKGIDFHIELKKEVAPGKWVFTNYRLAVQLKASESVKTNKDGSFTLQIDSSNVNYLLNNAMPAFYVFFHKSTKSFYYEDVRIFLAALHQKEPEWSKKEKHALRFSKKLDELALHAIYEQTLANGILLRQVNQYLKTPSEENISQGILIDHNNAVYNAADNIEYLDQYGAYLINKHQFNYIIEIEQKTHPRQDATPRFNLFCGIAYYQRGNLYKAIDLLKIAELHSESFDSNMQAALAFTLLNGKHLLGIISKQDFDKEMQKLSESGKTGTYFQIEKAYSILCNARSDISNAFKIFCGTVENILENETNNELRIIAYSKVVSAESTVLLNDLTSNFCYFIGRVTNPLQTKTYLEWLEMENRFLNQIDELVDAANKYEYQIGIANLIIFRIKWNYEKAIHTHYLSNWNVRFFDISAVLDEKTQKQLLFDCIQLEKIAESYDAIEFRENMLSCYLLEFQIFHFLRRDEKAQEIKIKILNFTKEYEFAGLQKQYEEIFNGNTAHQQFINKYTVQINQMQDFATKNGIDIYSLLDSDKFNHNPSWSFTHFFEFTFA
ncbi:DUF4365 domain-containing protein [Flavobacterium panici]|uniref:DUF4365 domain-containing protein n=1 Tax=Flavobacterium panici TaxID=2654843 RepID=A0A9N8P1U0_9FLAO|nr:DUF4365 domain-containing protein [Flavobacterium panici]CAC9974385.1 hypothetical protein FLAPXU55_02082 [Flavobacterium panici]